MFIGLSPEQMGVRYHGLGQLTREQPNTDDVRERSRPSGNNFRQGFSFTMADADGGLLLKRNGWINQATLRGGSEGDVAGPGRSFLPG